ncbi:MAG: HAD-IA family hydrolase [Verrucomicrobiota bacterium]
MVIKFIFFDAGGTLLRTARKVGVIYAEVASHYGWQGDGEFLHRSFIHTWKQMKPRDPQEGARVMDDKGWWKEVVRRTWSVYPQMPQDFPFDDYFEEVYTLFERADLWRLFPEVEETLQRLKSKGMSCGVLSNWDRRLRAILDGLALSPYFEQIIISSEVGVEKPHPMIFQLAQKRVHFKPEEIVLIGDDEYFDGAARNQGWHAEIVERPEKSLDLILEKLLII